MSYYPRRPPPPSLGPLFDRPKPTIGMPETPLARTDDIPTSHIAERQLVEEGRFAKQAGAVLALVRARPDCTAREYDAVLPGSLNAGGQCHKRLPDLEKKGLVEKGQIRPCRITGRLAATWHVKRREP